MPAEPAQVESDVVDMDGMPSLQDCVAAVEGLLQDKHSRDWCMTNEEHDLGGPAYAENSHVGSCEIGIDVKFGENTAFSHWTTCQKVAALALHIMVQPIARRRVDSKMFVAGRATFNDIVVVLGPRT
jgi:hypothetical protein